MTRVVVRLRRQDGRLECEVEATGDISDARGARAVASKAVAALAAAAAAPTAHDERTAADEESAAPLARLS